MVDTRNLRRLLLFACAAVCAIVVGIIYGHPETQKRFSLLYIPAKLVHRAFAETQKLNSRSELLRRDLESLEKDLGLSDQSHLFVQNKNTRDLNVNTNRGELRDDGVRHLILSQGTSEYDPKLSDDFENDAKDRIVSGEWPSGVIQADQAKGFYPKEVEAMNENRHESLLAVAEQQAKQKLERDFRLKEQQLKRVFRYKEELLAKVAQQLAEGHTRPSRSTRGSSTPQLSASYDDGEDRRVILPSAGSASELIGPSGLVVGDGTRLRKDTVPVGLVRNPAEGVLLGRRISTRSDQLASYSYDDARRAAEARLRRRAGRATGADREADREAPAEGEWAPSRRKGAVALHGLTWPPPVAGAAVPSQELASARIYKGDYNWPTSGQVRQLISHRWMNR